MQLRLMALTTLILLTVTAHSSTKGLCENVAITKALKTAPGTDQDSPASVTEIKLIKTDKLDSKTLIEEYYVQTEDQGGTAASIISVEVKNVSLSRVKCRFIAQNWVE